MSRDNKLVMLALFLWGSGEGLFLYILPLYMEQLGATPEQVDTVLAIAAFLAACSFIPGGWLADRFDPKQIMIAGWALGGVASIMMGLAADWRAIVPGVLIYHVALFCIPAINTYVSEASTTSLEQTLTLNFASFAAGGIIAPFIGGRLSESIGTPPLFLIASAIFFNLDDCHFYIDQPRRARTPIGPLYPSPDAASTQSAETDGAFLRPHHLCIFAMSIGTVLVANYLGAFGWSIADVNTLGGTAQAIGMTTLAIGLGRLAAHRPRRGLILGQALGFASMLILLHSSTTDRLPVMIGYFLIGSLAPVRELANAQIAGQADRAARGLALGVNETLSALARSLAAALAGLLFTIDARWPFIAALITIPVGIILTALPRTSAASPDEIIVLASTGSAIIESLEE